MDVDKKALWIDCKYSDINNDLLNDTENKEFQKRN